MKFPFITGSLAYGTPTSDSDIDIVIPPMSETDLNLLRTFSEGGAVLRFGKLNIIIAPTEEAFDLWKQCNDKLEAMSPVTRGFAVSYIESAFKSAGIERFIHNSGE